MKVLRIAAAVGLVVVWIAVAASFKDAGWVWLGGALVAAATLAALPLVLAVDVHRPTAATARTEALQTRRTAVMLLGAAALLGAAVVLGTLTDKVGRGPAFAAGSVFYVWTALGFGAAARITGALIDPHGGPTRQFVLGWIVRALVLATPLVWPALLAYQVMTSMGCTLVGAMTAGTVDEGDGASDA